MRISIIQYLSSLDPSEKTIKPFRDVTLDEDQLYSPDDPDILEQIRQANEATPILTATVIDSLDPEGQEEQQGFSTDESDDEFLTSHSDVDVTTPEPVSGNLTHRWISQRAPLTTSIPFPAFSSH
jgi:hypothetical protein